MRKFVMIVFVSFMLYATSIFTFGLTPEYTTNAVKYDEYFMGTVKYNDNGLEKIDTVLVIYFSLPLYKYITFMNKSFNPFNSLTKIDILDSCIKVDLVPINGVDVVSDIHLRNEIRKNQDYKTALNKYLSYDTISGMFKVTDSLIISYQPESMIPYYNCCVKWNFHIRKSTSDDTSSLIDELQCILSLLEKQYTNFSHSITLDDIETPVKAAPIEFSNIEEILLYQKKIKLIPY